MKKLLLTGMAMFLWTMSYSQIFSDNFDSYQAGDYLISSNPQDWSTWSNQAGGGTEDTKISDADAKSAPNSLYFKSTSTNGGPSDIILRFEDVYDVGNFTLDFDMKVVAGKGAYFNLQQNHNVGEVWALQCYLLQDGTMKFDNGSDGQILLTANYPNGQWFNMKLQIDLTTNVWEVFVDNISVGTFSNTVNSIGILDIYPSNSAQVGGNGQSEFYLDNISYDHVIPNLPPVNGGVTYVAPIDGIAGQSVPVDTKIRNLGTDTITSFDLTYNYNGADVTEHVSNVHIASLAYSEYSFTAPVTLVAGTNNLTVTVSNVNGNDPDANTNDDSKSISVSPTVPAPGKIVVSEEATGTWCVWCPRGHVFMHYMQNKYDGYWAGIAVHNNDPMTVAPYDAGMGTKIQGYPSALVDRGTAIDPSEMEGDFITRIKIAPKATLKNGATFDPVTRKLDVTVTYTFNSAKSGNWKAAVALTENGVTGTGSGYNQGNSYAGGGAGVMGGYETLPNPVPASQMVYDHVARAIAPSFAGSSTVFPASIDAGTAYTICYSFTLPSDWDESNMHIVGMLIDPSGKIDNASYSSVDEAITNGLATCDAQGTTATNEIKNESEFNLYPNPANNMAFVELSNQTQGNVSMTLTDLTGKVIATRSYNVTGKTQLPINVNNLAKGTYIVTIQTNGVSSQKKLVVN